VNDVGWAAESVERAAQEWLHEPAALVADADADQGVCWYDGESDAAVAVGEGVVDEIDDRLFKVERIGMNKDVGAFDLELTLF